VSVVQLSSTKSCLHLISCPAHQP